jgi:transposase-like protein
MDIFTPITNPPFCPNPACRHHRDPKDWRFARRGTFARKHAPLQVQRYQCLACRRGFSSQTFALGYWCRRQDLFAPVFQALMACSGLRQVGRQLSLTRVTVACRVERLGRHCLLLNEMLRPKGPPAEPVVLDGFETFEHSQYAPMHLNLLVGARSWLVYGFTESELRRKGRMTDWQKKRRLQLEERHGRPDPRAVQAGVEDLLRLALPQGAAVELRSDEHPAYVRALRALGDRLRIDHRVTKSTEPRTPRNPLFAVNLADLLLRHGSSNHKRETIAFSKRRQAVVDRASIFVTWRNLLKSRSEKAQDDPPGVKLGLVPSRPSVEQVLARRLFPTHVELPPPLRTYYERRVMTRYLARQHVHALKFAF